MRGQAASHVFCENTPKGVSKILAHTFYQKRLLYDEVCGCTLEARVSLSRLKIVLAREVVV